MSTKPEEPVERRMNRALTQRYDMGALRALQKLENEYLEKLTALYNCEEDDLPIELDLLAIYNKEDDATKRAALNEMFAGAPNDSSELVETIIQDMVKVKSVSAATSSKSP